MLRLIESDCTQLCKYIHIRCEVRTPSVRKERCELRQVSMLPAIFLLCDITIVFSQLNNCLPKRFLCEKRSRQTPNWSGHAIPSLEGSIHAVRCGCVHASSQQHSPESLIGARSVCVPSLPEPLTRSGSNLLIHLKSIGYTSHRHGRCPSRPIT